MSGFADVILQLPLPAKETPALLVPRRRNLRDEFNIFFKFFLIFGLRMQSIKMESIVCPIYIDSFTMNDTTSNV